MMLWHFQHAYGIMKPIFKKLFIAGLILLLAATGVVWYLFSEKFTDTAEAKPDYTVNAMGLIKEFQQNDSIANKKYTEKIITVNGIVSEVLSAPADTTVNIKMSDTANGDYLIFTFQQQHLAESKKIRAGDSVSIKASCSGSVYSEILGTRYVSFKRAALNK